MLNIVSRIFLACAGSVLKSCPSAEMEFHGQDHEVVLGLLVPQPMDQSRDDSLRSSSLAAFQARLQSAVTRSLDDPNMCLATPRNLDRQ